MLKKISIITVLGCSYIYNVVAEETKYGYQLLPNQMLNLNDSLQSITSDADTKNLYGIYYNDSSTTELTANPLNIEVINSNAGNTSNRTIANGLYINGTSAAARPSLNLGDGSQITTKAYQTIGIFLRNSDLSASNLTVTANGQNGGTGISLIDSQATLTGNNTIKTTGTFSTGLAISNSTFTTDKINIEVSGSNSTAVNITNNTGKITDLGTSSTIKLTSADGYGISINKGSVIANDLTIENTGNNSFAVAVYNGTFTMNGGSVTSNYAGITTGGLVPLPTDYVQEINLTDVTISSRDRSLLISNSGNMTLERVQATSTTASALMLTNNGIVTANDTSLQGKNNVVNANTGQVTFSGNTNIISTDTNSNAIYIINNAAINTIPEGSTMNIVGNMQIGQSGTNNIIDLKMNTGSQFTGKSAIYDTNTGVINLDMTYSIWNMTDDSTTTTLALDNSTVNFTNSNFTTLTTKELSGIGLFSMKTDIAQQLGDLINITETTTGNHSLAIANQGSAATDGTETLTVVTTADGGGNFKLNNQVEAGGYIYGLRKASNDKDWELYALPSGGNIGGTQTSSALAGASFLNTSYLLNYIDNQTLLQRLGDLRVTGAGNATSGLWVKAFGGKLSSFDGKQLSGFDMPYSGTQLGIDKDFSVSSGTLLVGVMAGITQGNLNYKQGDGTAKNYTLGLYSTYYHDQGFYVDTVLKYNNIHNQFNVKDTTGMSVKGKGRTQGINASVEVGKRLWINDSKAGFYIEPQLQVSTGVQGGDTVKASNGLKIKLDSYNSTLGRSSAIIGYQTQGTNPINIYFKSGYLREFNANTSYKLNGSKEKNSFRGQWWDNGIGITANINKVHNIYMDANYAKGSKFDQKQLNLGYRYSF
ncbi:autotransporter outer membrane beta-barrel domain-containing protein [Entomomonas sp. E2T0]|uniref:autotransporter outer membrane beta-barrel domain-containing protein n=1 Tax=Entomomonas sp. E2T0 TaxID=2930213 RepID=UPI0022281EF8|nr:autotransporter outer membrane beta-barrel domain-containing protein [Entomomonas sp. E2T0]UYZ84944.1 autotransporter outer membrane beta-barrel domain-containing protein [Entomomonas sp. E2T0]